MTSVEESIRARIAAGELYSPYGTSAGYFVPKWLMRSDIPMTCAVLYGVLAWHDRGRGFCWPGRDLLAEEMGGVSVDTIDRCLAKMVELGLIEIHKTKGRRNVYTFPVCDAVQGSRNLRPPTDNEDQPQSAASRNLRPAAESGRSSRKNAGETDPSILNERIQVKNTRGRGRRRRPPTPLPPRSEWFNTPGVERLVRELNVTTEFKRMVAAKLEHYCSEHENNAAYSDYNRAFQVWLREEHARKPQRRAARGTSWVKREEIPISERPDRVAPPLSEIYPNMGRVA